MYAPHASSPKAISEFCRSWRRPLSQGMDELRFFAGLLTRQEPGILPFFAYTIPLLLLLIPHPPPAKHSSVASFFVGREQGVVRALSPLPALRSCFSRPVRCPLCCPADPVLPPPRWHAQFHRLLFVIRLPLDNTVACPDHCHKRKATFTFILRLEPAHVHLVDSRAQTHMPPNSPHHRVPCSPVPCCFVLPPFPLH